MTFEDLGLGPDVLKAVSDSGYDTPTPIQEKAIPYVLMGRDVLGTAQTGTGKTAGFTLPMIEILSSGQAKARMPRSLILEPTRELAAQVADNFENYGKYCKLSKALLIGGVSFSDQEAALDRGVDVLIATPGRLLDHFERGKVLLNGVKILVIDEADRMMDMGFIPDVERIVSLMPPLRQTLFFSATMSKEMRNLADKFLMNPKEVKVERTDTAAQTVTQGLVKVKKLDKRAVLRKLLHSENVKNAFIFCNRKKDVDVLHKSLVKHGFNAGALHGDMNQSIRMETLDSFKNDKISLLVCSDVAARGIDVQAVSHVFNFDVPMHAEDYIHRIGRTGRAGQEGHAFTLSEPRDEKYLDAIYKIIGTEIPLVSIGSDSGKSETAAPAHKAAEKPRRKPRGKKAPDEPAKDQPKDQEIDRANEPAVERADVADISRADRRKSQPRKRRGSEDDKQVVGLGDHVPAFLNIPIKKFAVK